MKITREGFAIIEGDTYLSAQIEREGRLDVQREFLEQFRKYIPVGGVVVDVGASLGDTSATFAEMVRNSGGTVYALEPNPPVWECLQHNMRLLDQVNCLRLGLGSCNLESASIDVDTNNVGASRLVPDSNGNAKVRILDVLAQALMLNRLDFLKIDAEGWEPLILEGARETINRFRPTMLIEVNDWPLGKMGFTRADIYSRLDAADYWYADFDGPYGDVLCLPKEKQ